MSQKQCMNDQDCLLLFGQRDTTAGVKVVEQNDRAGGLPVYLIVLINGIIQ